MRGQRGQAASSHSRNFLGGRAGSDDVAWIGPGRQNDFRRCCGADPAKDNSRPGCGFLRRAGGLVSVFPSFSASSLGWLVLLSLVPRQIWSLLVERGYQAAVPAEGSFGRFGRGNLTVRS